MPRHPPCALKNLTTKTYLKMLASTVQFSNNERSPSRVRRRLPAAKQLAVRPTDRARHEATSLAGCSLRTQQRAHDDQLQPAVRVPSPRGGVLTRCRPERAAVVDVPPLSTTPNANGPSMASAPTIRGQRCQMLLRKEVIQPHLPVRLPCYDLVPIASPTFDGSPCEQLGHRLRVLPTFVT